MPVFGEMEYRTPLGPVADPPDVMTIHGTVDVAAKVHPVSTLRLNDPPVALTLCVPGVKRYVHTAAACVT